MKFMLAILALSYATIAMPSPDELPVNPGGIGGLFKGPNSETIIKGPDGSIITAAVEGGEVHTKLNPVIVEEEKAKVIPLAPQKIEVVPNLKIATHNQNSEIVGPSGTISTRGGQSIVAGPASTTITGSVIATEHVVKGEPIAFLPISAATASPLSISTEAPIAKTLVAPSGIPVTLPSIPQFILGSIDSRNIISTPSPVISPDLVAIDENSQNFAQAALFEKKPQEIVAPSEFVKQINDHIDFGTSELLTLNPKLVIPPEIPFNPRVSADYDERKIVTVTPLSNIQKEDFSKATIISSTPTPEAVDVAPSSIAGSPNAQKGEVLSGQKIEQTPIEINVTPKQLFASGQDISANILQNQLAKSGIDLSQIHLANVPLSAVSPLIDLNNPINLVAGVPKLEAVDAWGRYGRDVKNRKTKE